MESITETARRIPPLAQHDDTLSESQLEEDVELLDHSPITMPLLTAPGTSSSTQIASMESNLRLQMASLCWTMFHLAWNRDAMGMLIFRMIQATRDEILNPSSDDNGQASRRLRNAILGAVLAGVLGPIFAALVNVHLTYKLGFGKVFFLGSALEVCAYVLQALKLPFPILAFSCFTSTFAMTLQVAHVNGYVTSFEHSSSKLGVVHSFYALGTLAVYLLVTNFPGVGRPYLWYLMSAGIAMINAASGLFVFGFRTQDECMMEVGESVREPETRHRNHYVQILRRKTLHLMAAFLVAYVSLEITIHEGIPHFIRIRSTTTASGSGSSYIAFFPPAFLSGLALGRVLLLRVSNKLGNRRSVLAYLAIAIIPISLWAVPSVALGIVATFAIGLVLGPVHPIVMDEAGNALPRWLRTGAIGWIGAVSTSSSRIASYVSFFVLGLNSWWFLPLLLLTLVILAGLWVCIPVNDRTRAD